ncbi:hypothetical protein Adt_21445 [Abeliophyllum distichum]|uniref:Uncharacterized protein n=1 Tax=Abeliophyllum distichum TaxID=126358 RepID=A0ABD1SZD4_9LAMI
MLCLESEIKERTNNNNQIDVKSLEETRLDDNLDPDLEPNEVQDHDNTAETLPEDFPGVNDIDDVISDFESDEIEQEETSLDKYQLTRNRNRRDIKPNPKYTGEGLMSFLLYTRKEVENSEPITYEEKVSGKTPLLG